MAPSVRLPPVRWRHPSGWPGASPQPLKAPESHHALEPHQHGIPAPELIGLVGYGGTFGLVALFPAAAILAVPTRAERYSAEAEPEAGPASGSSSSRMTVP
jgi:hypothetical protein